MYCTYVCIYVYRYMYTCVFLNVYMFMRITYENLPKWHFEVNFKDQKKAIFPPNRRSILSAVHVTIVFILILHLSCYLIYLYSCPFHLCLSFHFFLCLFGLFFVFLSFDLLVFCVCMCVYVYVQVACGLSRLRGPSAGRCRGAEHRLPTRQLPRDTRVLRDMYIHVPAVWSHMYLSTKQTNSLENQSLLDIFPQTGKAP